MLGNGQEVMGEVNQAEGRIADFEMFYDFFDFNDLNDLKGFNDLNVIHLRVIKTLPLSDGVKNPCR